MRETIQNANGKQFHAVSLSGGKDSTAMLLLMIERDILNTADTPRQLDNNIFQTSSIAQKYNCALTRLDFQQEEGLMSSLPLGLNQIEIQRGLTT